MSNKIKILWIVNDKYTNNFITVYNECKSNDSFEMVVMATDHLGYDFAPNITSKEMYDFLCENNIDCIDSYNSETQSYIDLADINPDYIFTTTPYDIYLPECYRSNELIKYGKLCNVEYGAGVIEWVNDYASLRTSEFHINVDYFFRCDNDHNRFPEKSIGIGCLKLDEYKYYGKSCDKSVWKSKDKYKIIWKPRWTMIEGDSTLYPYLEGFYDFLKDKEDKIEFVFLGHPLLLKNLETKGYADYYKENIEKLNTLSNFSICDDSDFLDTVLSADLLIADHSSVIAEFATTGKPLIYTTPSVALCQLGKKIVDNSYVANNFDDIAEQINNLLIGNDIKKEKREREKDQYFIVPPNNQSVAQYLLQFLKEDSINKDSFKRHIQNLLNSIKTKYDNEVEELNNNLTKELEEYKSKNIELSEQINNLLSENDMLKQKVNVYQGYINKVPKFIRKIIRKIVR